MTSPQAIFPMCGHCGRRRTHSPKCTRPGAARSGAGRPVGKALEIPAERRVESGNLAHLVYEHDDGFIRTVCGQLVKGSVVRVSTLQPCEECKLALDHGRNNVLPSRRSPVPGIRVMKTQTNNRGKVKVY